MSPPLAPAKKQPASTPTPAPVDAHKWAPLRSWSYPFALKNGKAADDPQVYLEILSSASDGFYPLGVNGVPHGGVHFGYETAGNLQQLTGVKAIADGVVLAYRLDTKYPRLDYKDGKKAYYSSGFVLVHHRLVLPPVPTKAGAAKSGSATAASGQATGAPTEHEPPADEVLEFYSLYMHTLDWAGYEAATKLLATTPGTSATTIRRPHYWKGAPHFLVGMKATDTQQRAAPKASTLDATPLDAQTGIHVRAEGSGSGRVLGILPRGSEVLVGPINTKGWAQITSILQGTAVGNLAGGQAEAGVEQGWVYTKQLESLIQPEALDSVVVLAQPYPVKAGEVVTYLGEYSRYREASALPEIKRPLVHIEVFTGDDLPTFLTKSRARAKQLPDSEKTVLVIAKGAQLVPKEQDADRTLPKGAQVDVTADSPSSGRWVKVLMKAGASTTAPTDHNATNTPSQAPVGNKPVWIERRQLNAPNDERRAWTSFPLKLAAATSAPAGFELAQSRGTLDQKKATEKAVDDKGVQWWEVMIGTEDGGAIHGWVCEKGHPQTSWQSPWAWPGFEVVDATGVSIADYFKRSLSVTGTALSEDSQGFKATAASVNAGDLIVKLEQAVDIQGDKNGIVTAMEQRQALRQPWLAQALTRLIMKYESEWGGTIERWKTLSPLMKERKFIWDDEVTRIEKLQWWDQVKGKKSYDTDKGFPGPTVYYLHPIGLIGNFLVGCSCAGEITKQQLIDCAEGHSVAGNYVDALNDAFVKYGIEKCINKAHFISQTMIESANYAITKEVLSSKGPAPAYAPYIGRGLIQLTGKGNYDSYGSYAKEDFSSSDSARIRLENTPHALLSAAWYYSVSAGVSAYGDRDDFIMVTMSINGGFNGYKDRLDRLNRVLDILSIKGCANNNINGVYKFESSDAYNKKRAAFAWGLWHDPGAKQKGPIKSKDEAIKGYSRYVELDNSAGNPKGKDGHPKDKGWYGIGKDVAVLDYCGKRLNYLRGA